MGETAETVESVNYAPIRQDGPTEAPSLGVTFAAAVNSRGAGDVPNSSGEAFIGGQTPARVIRHDKTLPSGLRDDHSGGWPLSGLPYSSYLQLGVSAYQTSGLLIHFVWNCPLM